MTTDAAPPAESLPAEPPAEETIQRTKEASARAGYRGFVAPVEANTKILITRGKVFSVRDPNSPTGMRDHRRDGDKFVEFREASLTTDDPDVIAWCEAHGPDPEAHERYHAGKKDTCTLFRPDICIAADHPQAAVWFYAKRSQLNLANQEPSLPGGVDVGAFMRGEAQDLGGLGGDVVRRTRELADQANSG